MYQAIARNVRLSWLLLGLFVLLILVMGYVFGQIVKQGYVGIAVALVVAAGGAWLPITTATASSWRSAARARSPPTSTLSCTTPWKGWPSPPVSLSRACT